MIVEKSNGEAATPLVSVIMNCFNSEKYLTEAIDSVVNQTFKNWELIFWDNQSSDNSAAILKSYIDSRIKYFYASNHLPLGSARNLAIEKASGKWLAFIDCDDYWSINKLELQLNAASESKEEAGLIYTPFNVLSDGPTHENQEKAKKYYDSIRLKPHLAESIYKRLLSGNTIIFSSVLVLRRLFNEVGGIDPELKQLEDFDLLIKIAMLTKSICIDYKAVTYRIHASNNSHSQNALSYQEFCRIFAQLPKTNNVLAAMKKNSSRQGIFLVGNGHPLLGFFLILKSGSIPWIIGVFLKKLIQAIGFNSK